MLAEQVYARLRADLLRGKLRPNERLVETELGVRLHASRSPVREALQRLVRDGFVIRGRQGWVVREFSMDEVKQVYEVRLALEGYATGVCAVRADAEAIEKIRSLADSTLAGDWSNLEGPALDELVSLNDEFHDSIILGSGNPRLAQVIHQHRTFYFNYDVARHTSHEQLAQSISEHEAIADAIAARDSGLAEKLAREHVQASLDVIVVNASPFWPALTPTR